MAGQRNELYLTFDKECMMIVLAHAFNDSKFDGTYYVLFNIIQFTGTPKGYSIWSVYCPIFLFAVFAVVCFRTSCMLCIYDSFSICCMVCIYDSFSIWCIVCTVEAFCFQIKWQFLCMLWLQNSSQLKMAGPLNLYMLLAHCGPTVGTN